MSDLQAARRQVVEQLATRARAWADSTDHDPGVTLLELMAFLADALCYYQDAVAEEATLSTGERRTGGAERRAEGSRARRFVGVRLQQGRVSIDADWNEGSDPGRFDGIYRAVVVDNLDPQQQRRLLVRAPGVSPDPLGWALPALTVTNAAGLPAPGDPVWVLFEAGDPTLPVWLA
jgi:Type VI secretion system/phage-baseplate injector OB domain